MKQHSQHARMHGGDLVPQQPTSNRQLSRMFGPVVYFFRTREGTVKIGWTGNLANRVSKFGGWDVLLAFYLGTLEDEVAEQARFEDYSLGHEFFTPGDRLIARINEIRDRLGVPDIDRTDIVLHV